MKSFFLKSLSVAVFFVLAVGGILRLYRQVQDEQRDRRLVALFRSSHGQPWQWKAKEVIYDYNQVRRALLVRHDYMGRDGENRRRLDQLEREIRTGVEWKEPIREYTVPCLPASARRNGFPIREFWERCALNWEGEFPLNRTGKSGIPARWRLCYDSEYLYFQAHFPDRELCLPETDALYEYDSFELFIMPEERYHTYVELVFSPDGRRYARWVSQTPRSRYELSDYTPASLRTEAESVACGWRIEGRIGFRDLPAYLRGNPARSGETLRLMMLRIDRSGRGTKEISTPVPFLYDGHNIFGYMKLTLQ